MFPQRHRPHYRSQEELSARAAAVDRDRDRIARRMTDDIIREMYAVGLRLQATAQLADSTVRVRLEVAVGELDLIIAEVRNVIFDCPSRLHPSYDDWTSNLCSDVLPLGVEFDSSARDAGTAWTREVTGT